MARQNRRRLTALAGKVYRVEQPVAGGGVSCHTTVPSEKIALSPVGQFGSIVPVIAGPVLVTPAVISCNACPLSAVGPYVAAPKRK